MTIRWVRSEQVLWRRVADGVLLLLPDDDKPVHLMGSAGLLWELLASPLSVEEAAESMASAFGITTDLAEGDIRPFLGELAARCVVRQSA